jgi:hypothetical protein
VPTRRQALRLFVVATAAALGFGALASSPVLASNRGREGTTGASRYGHVASGKGCKKTQGRHACRRTQKPKKPGSPSHPGAPAPSPTTPSAPTTPAPSPTAPGGPAPPGKVPGGSSPAAQFANALIGITYERYTSSSLGSDFTDDYTFCANNTFLEHTESYDGNGGYVVGDYHGTWNVTNTLTATSADVAYTTNNPNLPSSGTVLVTLVSSGVYIGGNGYYTKGSMTC